MKFLLFLNQIWLSSRFTLNNCVNALKAHPCNRLINNKKGTPKKGANQRGADSRSLPRFSFLNRVLSPFWFEKGLFILVF